MNVGVLNKFARYSDYFPFGFDLIEIGEKEKAVAEAQEILQEELVYKFETERKLKEQENKSEKDILNLKIANLTSENNRLNGEIGILKKALEEATRQVKEIAVKVIESGTKQSRQDLTNDL